MSDVQLGVIPFEREAVQRYFDAAIVYWENRIAEFKRENVRPHPRYDGARERLQIAGCYLDAYRQIGAAILGVPDSSEVEHPSPEEATA
jgi:hypothetical protein